MTELARLSDDLAAQTEAFLRRGGSITKLNWAGVPVDGTAIEPKPVRAYGRLTEVKVEPLAPTVEAPQPKAMPVIQPAPAPAPERVTDWAARVCPQAVKDMTDDLAHQQLAYTVQQLRKLRAEARHWLARLDARFPR